MYKIQCFYFIQTTHLASGLAVNNADKKAESYRGSMAQN